MTFKNLNGTTLISISYEFSLAYENLNDSENFSSIKYTVV